MRTTESSAVLDDAHTLTRGIAPTSSAIFLINPPCAPSQSWEGRTIRLLRTPKLLSHKSSVLGEASLSGLAPKSPPEPKVALLNQKSFAPIRSKNPICPKRPFRVRFRRVFRAAGISPSFSRRLFPCAPFVSSYVGGVGW